MDANIFGVRLTLTSKTVPESMQIVWLFTEEEVSRLDLARDKELRPDTLCLHSHSLYVRQ